MTISRMQGFGAIAGVAAMLLCGGAQAQTRASGGDSTAVGVGMICNTQDQAGRFLELRAKGTEARAAMQQVNKDAHDPRACGVAAIAFVRDATVQNKPVQDKLMQVVRITVIAGFNGAGWQNVSGTGLTQFAVLEGDGEAI